MRQKKEITPLFPLKVNIKINCCNESVKYEMFIFLLCKNYFHWALSVLHITVITLPQRLNPDSFTLDALGCLKQRSLMCCRNASALRRWKSNNQTAAQTLWFQFITYGITDFPQHEHVFCVREFLSALQKEVQRRVTLFRKFCSLC